MPSKTASSTANDIFIKGARMHNLKNIDVQFPRNKLIVVTGVSGSGKSSLTMDTLFAEGQRRYAESLSAYARQFMQRMAKPDVDYIKGLCPAIAIEQKVITRTPRSTVGSMTEMYDYLRLLYARVGKTYSPISGKQVKKDDVQDVVQFVTKLTKGEKIYLLTQLKPHAKRQPKEELNILSQKGFSRIAIKQKQGLTVIDIEDALNDKEISFTNCFLLVDRFIGKTFDEDDEHRIADSVQTAFFEGEGEMQVCVNEKDFTLFNNKFEADGLRFEEPTPNLFSFNNAVGACPTCEGFGQVLGIDENLVIPNKNLSVYEYAVAPWKGEKLSWWRDQFVKGAASINFPIHKAIIDLTADEYELLWQGKGKIYGIRSFFKEVEENLYKIQYRVLLSRYRGRTKCHTCGGYRLKKDALYVKINDTHIGQLCEMPIVNLNEWFKNLKLNAHDTAIAKRLLIELNTRLQTMLDVGLGYLTLNRLANTLSGGESQRIQLTRSLGSNLTDSLYILDEPSIGLHSRDTENLIKVLKNLRELGNTVIVVEHDEQMMREADYIVDMGPLASHLGGQVIAEGKYNQLIKNANSLTGKYLSGKLTVQKPPISRSVKRKITIEGAKQHNLKNITVNLPLNMLVCICGLSGSGKTTLIKQIAYPAIARQLGEYSEQEGLFKALTGNVDDLTGIEIVDQNPIGKSSRSNPITYVKAYDDIRDLYSKQPLSKIRGFEAKHFSFNVDGGRCDTCKGEGEITVEMQFLADVKLLCESCKGHRFKEEVLEVTYNQKNISDILHLSVDEALEFFKNEKNISNSIRPLADVGLGYIKLGQSSDTLSGGEAQRVKLASFLGKGKASAGTLFIFDEPTTGLHFNDINKLLASFDALIQAGHSVWVIEHNMDVIKNSDWIIELGPGAGEHGGQLVFEGTIEQLKKAKNSETSKYL
jgi:excinuclease ABC subunit A